MTSDKKLLKHPFDAIVNDHSKVLILGSFPSLKSFEDNFYYAHPRNAFWPILASIFDVTLQNNKQRRQFVLEKGIALWDSYGALRREDNNSSDTNLKDLQPNDFKAFFTKYPQIKHIFFTGKKAQEGYLKHFKEINIPTTLLPSTSAAYAAMSREVKEQHYRVIKEILES